MPEETVVSQQNRVRSSTNLIVAVVALFAIGATQSGCATFYVDSALKDVPAADFAHPSSPQPVQVLYSFQTKGTANARATDYTRKRVMDTLTASGVFSSVTTDPVPSGALLSITINNVPLTDDAFAKGFVTGFTFGLVGSEVGDGYVCTLDYQSSLSAPKISKRVRHAIRATMGAHAAPHDVVKASSIDEALTIMTRQAVGNALKDLAGDPSFGR
jgi:hypothetical protein